MDSNLIEIAKNIAKSAHFGTKRKHYNMPYFVHLGRVVNYCDIAIEENPLLLNEPHYHSKEILLSAAYAHDILEDTEITEEKLIEFGLTKEITTIVKELTNVPKKAGNREKRKALDNERLGKASRAAKIIKLADRYDNIQDLIVAFTKGQIDEGYYYMYLNETFELLNHIKVDDCVLYDELYKTIQLV